MVDYVTVFMTGFANGFATLTALEIWGFLKKHQVHKHPFKVLEDISSWEDRHRES